MDEDKYYDLVSRLLVELEHYFDSLDPSKMDKVTKQALVEKWLESRPRKG